MRKFALVLSMTIAALVPAIGQTIPQRVASINLCTDQLLLTLADPGQIASLSPFARDPSLSFLAESAKNFPQNRGTGENIVALDADLVLTGGFDGTYTRALLATEGVAFDIVQPWSDFKTGEAALQALARRLGHPERGAALVGAIEAALAKVRGAASHVTAPRTSLVLQRRGYVFHAGLTAEIAEIAGLHDAAPTMGVSKAAFVSLEALVAAHPDYLIVSDSDARPEDEGSALLAHPALEGLYPQGRRLVAPDRLAICEGPSTPVLIEALGDEIRAKVR
ncbi:MAG TPA: ABC transporter substrate-binding protein [Beijerinckiaceae bacterium]|nr:ABC transporter substrate-binding protein [Beijerinckiaceae bacterium]